MAGAGTRAGLQPASSGRGGQDGGPGEWRPRAGARGGSPIGGGPGDTGGEEGILKVRATARFAGRRAGDAGGLGGAVAASAPEAKLSARLAPWAPQAVTLGCSPPTHPGTLGTRLVSVAAGGPPHPLTKLLSCSQAGSSAACCMQQMGLGGQNLGSLGRLSCHPQTLRVIRIWGSRDAAGVSRSAAMNEGPWEHCQLSPGSLDTVWPWRPRRVRERLPVCLPFFRVVRGEAALYLSNRGSLLGRL